MRVGPVGRTPLKLRKLMPRLPETSSAIGLVRLRASAEPRDDQPQHAGVVAAAQAAVGGQHEQDRRFRLGPVFQQRMGDLQVGAGQVGDELGDLPRVGRRWLARSIAFLNRAVAISSIVRVILRMLLIDLRRLSIARAFAMIADALNVTSRWRYAAAARAGLTSRPSLSCRPNCLSELVDAFRKSAIVASSSVPVSRSCCESRLAGPS